MSTKNKVSREIAFQEVKKFLQKHKSKDFKRNKMTDDVIEEEYIDVIEAVESGNLIFEKLNPKYKLLEPLYGEAEDKSLVITDVNFRSRIREADKNLLMDGLDPKKQVGTYTIKYISYITQLSMTDVKQIEKDDFDVINQICSVF